MNFPKNVFEVFCLLSRNTYFNEHYLVAAPASTEQKHALSKVYIQTKRPLQPAKNTNYIALIISPDDYDITVNRTENVLMFLMFSISRKQPPASVHFNDFDF